jgi:hypothetical protein
MATKYYFENIIFNYQPDTAIVPVFDTPTVTYTYNGGTPSDVFGFTITPNPNPDPSIPAERQ